MAIDEVRRRRATSFGGVAEDYDRFRPGPPSDALDWVLPDTVRSAAEIGAGTGGLTRQLTSRLQEVTAVEPDARMRAVLASRVPQARVVEGRGEAIPLPDAAVDAVLASSSWHWVEQAEGFAEAARILRPGGVMGLLWTGPDRKIPWVAQLMTGGVPLSDEDRRRNDEERFRRHRPELPSGAPFTAPEVRVFRSSLRVTPEDLVGLWGTYSVAIVLEPQEREEVRRRVEQFVGSDVPFEDGYAELPMGCVVWRAYRD